ncbi:hypothetical protein OH77DRAFT_1419083 [Trametes cingulata]|nr:hypothetical protein OH77DRAFT_1419083 [Trametes cingulata]
MLLAGIPVLSALLSGTTAQERTHNCLGDSIYTLRSSRTALATPSPFLEGGGHSKLAPERSTEPTAVSLVVLSSRRVLRESQVAALREDATESPTACETSVSRATTLLLRASGLAHYSAIDGRTIVDADSESPS